MCIYIYTHAHILYHIHLLNILNIILVDMSFLVQRYRYTTGSQKKERLLGQSVNEFEILIDIAKLPSIKTVLFSMYFSCYEWDWHISIYLKAAHISLWTIYGWRLCQAFFKSSEQWEGVEGLLVGNKNTLICILKQAPLKLSPNFSPSIMPHFPPVNNAKFLRSQEG